jgi:hypothetical protein
MPFWLRVEVASERSGDDTAKTAAVVEAPSRRSAKPENEDKARMIEAAPSFDVTASKLLVLRVRAASCGRARAQ